jgi:hypothetical protein
VSKARLPKDAFRRQSDSRRDEAVDRTVPSFRGGDDLVDISKPRRPADGAVSHGIATQAFTWTILELIREAGQSLCVREMSDILAERSIRPFDWREHNLVNAKVRNAMP